MIKHRRIYNIFLMQGHSGWKALEVILDARRGSRRALRWIRLQRRFARR